MDIEILIIGDIHWGAMNAETMYENLQLVLNTIRNRNPKMVVIAGDYFDYKLALNSKPAIYAIQWMNELISICEQSNVEYIRIIKGTHEHDNNQLEAFRKYEENNNFFRIFNTNTIENLFGVKFIYCPDENLCNEDYENAYKSNLSSNPDIMLFHGNFDIVMPNIAVEYYRDNKINNVIFEYDLFNKIVSGPIAGGHWHISTIKDKLLYTGSFDRWKFGETEKKGFYIIHYNTESKEYWFEFIENENAKLYIDLSYDLTPDLSFSYYSELIDHIINCYNINNTKIKIVFNYTDDENGIILNHINSVKRYFINTKNVKIEIKDSNSKKKKKNELDNHKSTDMNEYNFIFDKKLSIGEKIQNFILLKKGKTVPIDIINKFIGPYIEKKGE